MVTLTFDLGVQVTCDVDYLCANFSLPRPLCSRVRPDVRDRRQTSDRQTDVRQHHRFMPPLIRGGGIKMKRFGNSDRVLHYGVAKQTDLFGLTLAETGSSV